MFEVTENPNFVERAYLVGLRFREVTAGTAEEHLDELAQLVDTMGVPVVGREVVTVGRPRPALLVGSGKADEIVEECRRLDADCLVFDDDLTPGQQRNWEKLSGICVIDRQEVILDIFAQRARTREARLQIRLARLEYSLPRLRRAWTHLERQRGGTGARGGAGELQLETDQRLVRDQIAAVKRELEDVRRRRAVERRSRGVKPTPSAALVGYTNAGKSSLLQALTDAETFIEDKLFATLDPLTRRVVLPNNQELVLVDTVGFIRKLPHDLVESFKATLEEARLADFLVHVVDAGHPQADEHVEATRAVLEELGAHDKPTVMVFNKADRLEGGEAPLALGEDADACVVASALTGEGMEELRAALARLIEAGLERLVVAAPPDRYDLVSMAHREGNVRFEGHTAEGTWIEVDCPRRLRSRFEGFIRSELPDELTRKGA